MDVLPDIAEISTDLLISHELTELAKFEYMLAMRRAGHVFEPIQVQAHGGRFVVLDGAHRTMTARAMGMQNIPAKIWRLPSSAAVPGWSHLISREIALSLIRNCTSCTGSPGQAVVDLDGRSFVLGVVTDDPVAMHAAFHALANAAYSARHRPVAGDDRNVDAGCGVLTWTPPSLDVLTRIAVDVGPLPQTLTRFESLFSRYEDLIGLDRAAGKPEMVGAVTFGK